jgi:hypothetical protein
LTHARTTSAARANILVLLASLAHLFAVTLGLAAEEAQLHRRFQANTVRKKRVFSLAMLGRLVVSAGTAALLDPASILKACTTLDERLAREHFAQYEGISQDNGTGSASTSAPSGPNDERPPRRAWSNR